MTTAGMDPGLASQAAGHERFVVIRQIVDYGIDQFLRQPHVYVLLAVTIQDSIDTAWGKVFRFVGKRELCE